MSRRRVVITGMGLISPIGNNIRDAWHNACEGVSGIGLIDAFDTAGFSSQIAGLIRDFDANAYIDAKSIRKMDPFMHYGIAATKQAIEDSGLIINEKNANRIGISMGAGIGGIDTIEKNHDNYLEKGARRISPFFVPSSIINMISGHISIEYGITGPNLALATACATSTHSIGVSARLIAAGDAEVIFAGGAEYATTPLGIGGFCSARALSTRNDEPERASRPWDLERDGFVLSDGAGCLALEEYEYAKDRGAHIYAEVAGFGMSADAHHITAPPEKGQGASACMRNALQDAQINPEQVGYINAHGTSTPLGDLAETRAIKAAFGGHAKNVSVSSTKSTTGHMVGAAGAVEAIFTVLALRDQVIPPTINLKKPDPECDLDYTPNVARELKMSTALSNSFGFGGTNGSIIFQRLA